MVENTDNTTNVAATGQGEDTAPWATPVVVIITLALLIVAFSAAWQGIGVITGGNEIPLLALERSPEFLAAVLGGAATLLLTGVILTAPILSLTLHQANDPLFELAKEKLDPGATPEEQKRHEKACREIAKLLEERLEAYGRLNPWYLGIWRAATGLLIMLVLVPLAFAAGTDYANTKEVLVFALSLFWLASAVSAAFAFVSLWFFMEVKPGITKLKIFSRYLGLSTAPPRPATPRRRIPGWLTEIVHRIKNTLSWIEVRLGKWVWLLVPLALGGVCWFLGCIAYRGDRRPAPTTLAINSNAMATAPIWAADAHEKGSLGFNLTLVPFSTGRDALKAVAEGRADCATAAEVPFLIQSLSHTDLRIVATIARSPIRIVGRKASFSGPDPDFRGKKFGVVSESSSEYALQRFLANHDLGADDAGVPMGPSKMSSALLGKQSVDAVVIWEPSAEVMHDALGADALEFEQSGYVEHFLLVSTTDVLGDVRKRASIAKLIQVSRDAMTNIPDAVLIKLVAGKLGYGDSDLATIRRAWAAFDFSADQDDTLSSLHEVEKWLAEHRSPKRIPRTDDGLKTLMDPL